MLPTCDSRSIRTGLLAKPRRPVAPIQPSTPMHETYRIQPGSKLRLGDIPSNDDAGLNRDDAEKEFKQLSKRLVDLQEILYAQKKHSLLVVLQAMDTAGKDSTIRSVFSPLDQLACHALSFKAPSQEERDHDFLWRVHQRTPAKGFIHIFNRSHYEDVLVVRVKNLVPKEVWKARYDHINAFEKMLADEGTTIVKFYLHISKGYQKERLQRRLDNADKHWKFNPDDLKERAVWDDYMAAYDDVLERCSTKHAPWYVIPAEKRWFRDLLVARIMVATLESLDMKYPDPAFDPRSIVIE
ncbi:MAG: polyphosphate kinase 2 family protein [Phycisphaeraceae bacterium]